MDTDRGMLMKEGQVDVEEERDEGGGEGLLSSPSAKGASCRLLYVGCGGGEGVLFKNLTFSFRDFMFAG